MFDLLHYYIYQCLGLVLWSTEVLTEGLPLLIIIIIISIFVKRHRQSYRGRATFSIVIFSIVIFIMWTFSANKHMDGWMTIKGILLLSISIVKR